MSQGMASNAGLRGPASATDNAIARYDGTTGRVVQNSAVTIDDSGNVVLPAAADIYTTAWDTWAVTFTVAGGTNPVYTETNDCRYMRLGNTIFWVINVDAKAADQDGSGVALITFNLPVNAKASANANLGGKPIGSGSVWNGAGTRWGSVTVVTNGATESSAIILLDSIDSFLTGNDQNNAARSMILFGHYEAA